MILTQSNIYQQVIWCGGRGEVEGGWTGRRVPSPALSCLQVVLGCVGDA